MSCVRTDKKSVLNNYLCCGLVTVLLSFKTLIAIVYCLFDLKILKRYVIIFDIVFN